MDGALTRSRRVHRILGIVLLLPLCGWVATATVFLLKPGYGAAYGFLDIKKEGEERRFRSVLGEHVLVKRESGWTQRDPLPDDAALRRLIEDAIASNPERYGTIATFERTEAGAKAETSTGAAIELDWPTMSLSQQGKDTRLLDTLYKVHYLQWTGIPALDRVVGAIGLATLLVLTALGARLAFAGR